MLVGTINQYIHSVATNFVYYLHEQRPTLKDLGYELLPELSTDDKIASEILVYSLFIVGIAFFFAPFYTTPHNNPIDRLYTVVMLKRFLNCLVILQWLRIFSFLSTILPGPAEHCQAGSELYSQPTTLTDILFRMDASYGCGDLMFSSHTIFSMSFVLLIFFYSANTYLRAFMAAVQLAIAPLIIAARKHYTLDVFTALYTVPLIWFWYDAYFPDAYVLTSDADNQYVQNAARRQGRMSRNRNSISLYIGSGMVSVEKGIVDLRHKAHVSIAGHKRSSSDNNNGSLSRGIGGGGDRMNTRVEGNGATGDYADYQHNDMDGIELEEVKR